MLAKGAFGAALGCGRIVVNKTVLKPSRCWVVRGVGVYMSEVVVQISADEGRDSSRLTKALDAFAKWSAEAGLSADSSDAPDIMMMTEYSQGEMRRKLVFQDPDHAARFLVFWRTEKHRFRMPEEPMASGA